MTRPHDVVKVLLHHKCTVDARDHDGVTPLYLATYYGNYEVMKMLVAAFADVNAVTKVIFTCQMSFSVSLFGWDEFQVLSSLVPRPRPAFRRLQYG